MCERDLTAPRVTQEIAVKFGEPFKLHGAIKPIRLKARAE